MILLSIGIVLVILSQFMAWWCIEKCVIFAIGMGCIFIYLIKLL